MVDNFGYHWDLTKLQAKGPMAYLEVPVDVLTGFPWAALGEISPPTIFGEEQATALSLTATNPQADACAGPYTDSFTYVGDRIIPGVRFAGTWESFCGGSVFASGSWDGTFYHGSCQDLVLPSMIRDPFGATFDVENSGNPNAATVYNHPTGTSCSFPAEGGFYSGPATIVGTSGGNVNIQCNARLDTGTPVDKGTRIELDFSTPFGLMPCDVQLTPSGNGNVSCHARAAFSAVGGKAPVNQVSAGGTVEWPAGLVTYGLNA